MPPPEPVAEGSSITKGVASEAAREVIGKVVMRAKITDG